MKQLQPCEVENSSPKTWGVLSQKCQNSLKRGPQSEALKIEEIELVNQ